MKIVYIAHPIGGDVELNLSELRWIINKINKLHSDVVPFCPYYADVVSMNDDIPSERERGIQNGHELFKRKFIDEVWVYGNRISSGVAAEIKLAEELGIPVIIKDPRIKLS